MTETTLRPVRRLQWLALILALTVVTGCPGKGDAGSEPSGEQTPKAEVPDGPLLGVGVVGDMAPVLQDLVYDTLLRLDEDSALIGGVFKKWSEPEPATWRFQIRPGVTFHAHPCLPAAAADRQVTARDIVYSLELAAKQGALDGLNIRGLDSWLAGESSSVFGLQTVGGEVLNIQLQQPAAFLLHRLAEVTVRPRALGRCADAAAAAQPVGTGAFALTAAPTPGQPVRLLRNPHYWERAGVAGRLPHLGGIALTAVAGSEAGARAIAAGTLDVVLLDPASAATVVADVTARRPALADELGIAPELVEPFVDVRQRVHELVVMDFIVRSGGSLLGQEPIRRAIAHAIKRADFRPLDPLLLTPTTRYLYPQLAGYAVPRPQVQYDWELSRELLGATGLDLATLPALAVAIPKRFAAMAEPLQRQLERIGLKMRVVADGQRAELVVRLVAGEVTGKEPWPFLRLLVGGLADAGLGDPTLDEITGQVELQPDAEVRTQYYDRIEERLLETRPMVPLGRRDPYTPLRFGLVSPGVQGLHDRETRRALLYPGSAFAHAKKTVRQ